MKKLLIIILLLFSFNAFGQVYISDSRGYSGEYDFNTWVYFERLPMALSEDTKREINNFVEMLKDTLGSSDLTTDFDILYLFNNENNTAGLYNLIKPAHDITVFGSPTYSKGYGYIFNGTAYFLTNYSPSSNSVTFTLNSSSMGVFTFEINLLTVSIDMGSRDGTSVNRTFIQTNVNDSATSINISTSSTTVNNKPPNYSSPGLTSGVRVSSDSIMYFKDGVKYAGTKQTSTGLASSIIAIAGLNTNGIVALQTRQGFSMVFMGRKFTDTEMRGIYNCYLYYLNSLNYYTNLGEDTLKNVWSWFGNPRAVYYNGKSYVSGLDDSGYVSIYQYDSLGIISKYNFGNIFEIDDHDNPAILLRSDGKLNVYYQKHVGSLNLFQRVSTNEEDISEWGFVSKPSLGKGLPEYVYTIPIEIDDSLYLFFRSEKKWYYMISVDLGITWGTPVKIIDSIWYYPEFVKNGDRIDVTIGRTPSLSYDTSSVYHFYIENSLFYKSDGSSAGSPPFHPKDDFTTVFDGVSDNHDSWVYDISVDSSGNPIIAYVVYVNPTTDHSYRIARWNGSAWVSTTICSATRPLRVPGDWDYSAGIAIDRTNPNILYISRDVDDVFQIFKYISTDGGATFDEGTQLTTGEQHSFRPVCTSRPEVFYLYGRYTSYTNYDTYLRRILP